MKYLAGRLIEGFEIPGWKELEIINRGEEPTFHSSNGAEVIDITLGSHALIGRQVNWRVSDEPSLPDHRQINFILNAEANKTKRGPNRNPKNTNWTSLTE